MKDINKIKKKYRKKCEVCGSWFDAKSSCAKTCSDSCKKKRTKECVSSYQKKKAEQERIEKINTAQICEMCGKEFHDRRIHKYCSKTCSDRKMSIIAKEKYDMQKEERKQEIEKIDQKCEYCGCIFHERSIKKYCSKRCMKNKNNLAYYHGHKHLEHSMIESESSRKRKSKPTMSLADVCKAAREHGMSYGEYVVLLEKERS